MKPCICEYHIVRWGYSPSFSIIHSCWYLPTSGPSAIELFWELLVCPKFKHGIRPYGKMMMHLTYTLYMRCHAPVTYRKPYRLYGVLWQTGSQKCTKGFLTLYYRPKLTFYGRNMKATSSYFILNKRWDLLWSTSIRFSSPSSGHSGFTSIYNVLGVKVQVE